jgi:hypothetical protein
LVTHRVGANRLANYVRDFEGMALPLRTNVRFTRQPQLVLSREARVYDSGVGPGTPNPRLDGPRRWPVASKPLGR